MSWPVRLLVTLVTSLAALLSADATALRIDGGVDNTFVVTGAGRVAAWGGNVGGKLGNGATINSSLPVMVLTPGVVSMAGGNSHTCLVHHGGLLSCWGYNVYGQVGDGTTVDRLSPTVVAQGIQSVAAGDGHTCAVDQDSAVKCWGLNNWGQLGDGPTAPRSLPQVVQGLAATRAVAAGEQHTCALSTTGAVTCWGNNGYGQLGNGTTVASSTPVGVTGLSSGVTAIAAGAYHTCAIGADTGVKCWGQNTYGQIGDNSTTGRAVPTAVSGLSSGATLLAAGVSHSCAATSNGAMFCWGDNWAGQLGDGTTVSRIVPAAVTGMASGVRAIAAGYLRTCATTSEGAGKCWGYNSNGAVGDGSTATRTAPVNVSGLPGSRAIGAGWQHTCAITISGWTYCWGLNAYGQLGDGTTTARLTAQRATSVSINGPVRLSGIVAVSAGMGHTLALGGSGTVYAWGLNHHGQLGIGQDASLETCFTPHEGTLPCSTYALPVPALSGMSGIGTGWNHSIALRQDGTIWTWGDNSFGQLGTGNVSDPRFTPVQVIGGGGYTQVAGGYFHNAALKGDGTLVTWGRGDAGQIGNGTFSSSTQPVPVLGGVLTMSTKGSHTLALRNDFSVWAWGLNHYGQVGNGAPGADVASPVRVLDSASDISAGMSFSFAGGFAWGLNTSVQLDRSTGETCNGFDCISRPYYVGIYPAAAGGAHAMSPVFCDSSYTTVCSVVARGDNTSGQLGSWSPYGVFEQSIFDPGGKMFPAITDGSGTSIGANSSMDSGMRVDLPDVGPNFGQQQVHMPRAPLQFVVTNRDSAPLTISSLTVSSGGFSGTTDCIGTPISSGGGCVVDVTFTPPGVGHQYGLMEVTSDALDSPYQQFSLQGYGVGFPAAPTDVVAFAANAAAVVTFSPVPLSHAGGVGIASYAVTSNPGGMTGTAVQQWLDGEWRFAAVIQGLSNGTPYTFTVKATNEFGLASPDSAPSNAVVPGQAASVTTVGAGIARLGMNAYVGVTVSGPAYAPTGTVTVKIEGTPVASCTSLVLSSGSANCFISGLAFGSYGITAEYSGDANFLPSTSPVGTLQVVRMHSRKSHGSAGTYDIALDATQPLSGDITTEPRDAAGGHRIVFEFPAPILSFERAVTTAGTVASSVVSGNDVEITITGVADVSRSTIWIEINGSAGSLEISLGCLVGDADGSRSVNATDVAFVKSFAGEVASASNFRHDVNHSGAITAADILVAKGRLGLALP